MADILIYGGTLVSDGLCRKGWITVGGERITALGEGEFTGGFEGRRIDAAGMIVMPGVIDDHVHFREPGLTYKGDIGSESRAAVAGGVTSFMEMPNTKPATDSLGELERKFETASVSSLANYSFYLGATNENLEQIKCVDPGITAGIKLFMGSSTGNMLVDDDYTMSAVFAESPVLIAAHCEDEAMIRRNTEAFRVEYGDGITPRMHQLIRNVEACYRSSARAVELADKYGSHLHILHISTARELSLFDAKPLSDKKITAEACVHHLWFTDADYATLGNLLKVNPAVKTAADRDAIRKALADGRIDIVGTDHAPHTFAEKQRPYLECPSGLPAIQHSLPAMLELAVQGILSVEQVVEKMCHAPAVRYGIRDRGFLRAGAYADIAIVNPASSWTVERGNLLYKCEWSPLEGTTFSHSVDYTIMNGRIVNDRGRIDDSFRGKPLEFDR